MKDYGEYRLAGSPVFTSVRMLHKRVAHFPLNYTGWLDAARRKRTPISISPTITPHATQSMAFQVKPLSASPYMARVPAAIWLVISQYCT